MPSQPPSSDARERKPRADAPTDDGDARDEPQPDDGDEDVEASGADDDAQSEDDARNEAVGVGRARSSEAIAAELGARPGCLGALSLLGFLLVVRVVQWLIGLLPSAKQTFLDPSSFPWVARVEAGARAASRELDALLGHVELLPNFQDIQQEERRLTQDDRWKVFPLYGYGIPAEENLARCPSTKALLAEIPGMTTAMFSILRGQKHIPPHRGPYKGVLRYHLALRVPGRAEACRIRVGPDTRSWVEGKSLVFDDTHEHEVWKESEGARAVLFVDFLRPLPAPLSWVNRWTVRAISRRPFIQRALENLGRWERATGPRLDAALSGDETRR